jgi:hypothetical protein
MFLLLDLHVLDFYGSDGIDGAQKGSLVDVHFAESESAEWPLMT